MVIVNPDGVTTLVALDHLLRKSLVDAAIKFPAVIGVGFALGMVRNLVMKDSCTRISTETPRRKTWNLRHKIVLQ